MVTRSIILACCLAATIAAAQSVMGPIGDGHYRAGMPASVATPAIPTNGLVNYWLLEGNGVDSVGTNNGVASNIIATNGVKGNAGTASYFNGVNSQIGLGDPPNLSFTAGGTTDLAFSVSFWVYPTQPLGAQYIFAKFYNAGGVAEYGMGLGSNAVFGGTSPFIQLFGNTTGKYIQKQASNSIPLNAWSHCVYTYDATKIVGGLSIYTNGVLASCSNTIVGVYVAMQNTTDKCYIGRREVAPVWYTKGRLDELMIYNRVLAPTEVTTIYNIQK